MAREGDGSKIDADRSKLNVRVDLIRFFFCYPLEDKIVYIIQSRSSFSASPSCRPQLRFGLQSLGLAQKETVLLLKAATHTEGRMCS
jgi:hypothetical protein